MLTILFNFSIQAANWHLENTIFTRRKRNKPKKKKETKHFFWVNFYIKEEEYYEGKFSEGDRRI
jgi:hypothetical protein